MVWILWNVSHHDVILCPEVLRHSSLVSSSLGRSERHICPLRLSVLPVEVAHESSGALRVRKRAAVHHHLPGAREEEGSREAHDTIWVHASAAGLTAIEERELEFRQVQKRDLLVSELWVRLTIGYWI